MMTQIAQNRLNVVAGLFKEHRRRRSAIDHILEGNNGIVEVDDEDQPTVARFRLGYVTLFGGDPLLPAAREMVDNPGRAIAVPETDDWYDLLSTPVVFCAKQKT